MLVVWRTSLGPHLQHLWVIEPIREGHDSSNATKTTSFQGKTANLLKILIGGLSDISVTKACDYPSMAFCTSSSPRLPQWWYPKHLESCNRPDLSCCTNTRRKFLPPDVHWRKATRPDVHPRWSQGVPRGDSYPSRYIYIRGHPTEERVQSIPQRFAIH